MVQSWLGSYLVMRFPKPTQHCLLATKQMKSMFVRRPLSLSWYLGKLQGPGTLEAAVELLQGYGTQLLLDPLAR